MSTIDASKLLRPGLLHGVSILLAGAHAPLDGGGSFAATVRDACSGLGARVSQCALFDAACATLDESTIDAAVDRALAEVGSIDLLAVDGADLFAHAGAADLGGEGAEEGKGADGSEGADRARAALVACLDASWNVTRAVANHAFLPGPRGGRDGGGGRIVYLAPPPDAGEHADAARAGLENLARTLSIEWARHAVTPVAIAPGPATMPGEIAALTAYLASPAGAYFSGCLLDLRGAAARG
jgi:NAD(P)-dependent dehydrogenase (short-subunit alcohol dehydrogenase family)